MKITGLTKEQVERSKAQFGDNRMTEQKSETFWHKLFSNFGDPMIKILCVALLINVIFTFLGKTEWYESVGIALAVILATFVSTFSEFRNENAFQKLQEEASRIFCKVYRDGKVAEVSINDIVVGDCIMLQTGDKISADGVIIDGNIKVDQSVLNGESKEAGKTAIPDDYKDDEASLDFLNPYKVFRGAVVCSGSSVMRVTTVGDKSVYGQIASELQQDTDRESPLKLKLAGLAKGISKFGYIGGITIALAFMFQSVFVSNSFDGAQIAAYFSDWMTVVSDVLNAVMLAVIIIVMAVPEGLPLMVALVSALNMGKMLKDNVLVRKIVGIETAGSLNILFSDKTGTITKGKLEAVTFVDGRAEESKNFADIAQGVADKLLLSIYNNTDAVISEKDGEVQIYGGNATERAVLRYAVESGRNAVHAKKLTSIPFSSDKKYSASTVDDGGAFSVIKGAPEKMLARCSYYYDENGEKKTFDDERRQALDDKINALAKRAIRVLAFATSDDEIKDDVLPEGEWTLIGVLGIRDEVRPESVTAIKEVQAAGVQVVMITGDRLDTAAAIAREAGIVQNESDIMLTSDHLAQLSDDEVKSKLSDIRVIARALPSDKSRLVRLAQEMGLVAGMTGDGVNDSPALKKADVGFAMGGGTEVAKEASDIVILDDNFNSIDKAILYGRTIFNSIRKFIVFQLTINISAVLVCFAAPLLGIPQPLSIIQILWVNLVMDTLAALAFGGEPALERYMQEEPKRRDESIVSKYMWTEIVTAGIWCFVLSMFLLFSDTADRVFRDNHDFLMTGYFTFFIFFAVFNAFNARTEKLNLFDNIIKNHGFWQIMIVIIIIQIILTNFGGDILHCYGLHAGEWLFVILLAFTIIPIDLLRKAVLRIINK